MAKERMQIDIKGYHKSISAEFKALQNRVRCLIGSSHWGEEGRYKEVILINALKKYLPQNFSIGTGFIMNNNDYDSVSKQIDIIIYKNNYPVIFKEGDFVILNSKNVVGIIEVKSKYDNSKFEEVFVKAENNGSLVSQKIFNGIFYFDVKPDFALEHNQINDNFKSVLEKSKGRVNHIALGEDKFIRYWEDGNPELNNGIPCMSLYKLNGLSFSYFISNLIEMAYSLNKPLEDSLEYLNWFLYPIEGTKEACRVNNINIRLE